MPLAQPADERRHRSGAGEWWGETWDFDVVDPHSGLAAFTQLTVHPRRNTCWFWTAVIAPDRPYVLCRELDLTVPGDPLEIRGSGLWAHLICETPLEHWTVAMEAFALELDPPHEAWAGERGDRVGLAFDLEWESPRSVGDLAVTNDITEYVVGCEVHGELQVGDDTFDVDATGSRSHAWGELGPSWFAERFAPSSVQGTLTPWLLEGEGFSPLQLERRLVGSPGAAHWL